MTMRKLGAEDADVLARSCCRSSSRSGFDGRFWRSLLPHLLATRNVHIWVVEAAGEPVACGLLSIHKKVGQLRTGLVLPEARGRGLQRALIRERARFALPTAARCSPRTRCRVALRTQPRRLWPAAAVDATHVRLRPSGRSGARLTERRLVV